MGLGAHGRTEQPAVGKTSRCSLRAWKVVECQHLLCNFGIGHHDLQCLVCQALIAIRKPETKLTGELVIVVLHRLLQSLGLSEFVSIGMRTVGGSKRTSRTKSNEMGIVERRCISAQTSRQMRLPGRRFHLVSPRTKKVRSDRARTRTFKVCTAHDRLMLIVLRMPNGDYTPDS